MGEQSREVTLKLTQDGEKLTGTYVGRNSETPIENGKVADGEVSFTVTREFNGQKFTSKYKGKLDVDIIKGNIESERDGETRTREWEAKRQGPSAAGTWRWSFTRNDGSSLDFVVKLKQEGEKLSGTVGMVDQGEEFAIEEGKVSGAQVSFTVTREREGNKYVTKFQGQLEGDVIKGKVGATWAGEDRSFDWEAKRER